MSNPWFRMYSEFSTDAKVQMLSESDQRRFVMLLCLRCRNADVTLHKDRQMLPDDEIAFQLRISEEDWKQTKQRFIDKALIDDSNQPLGWDRRQFVSDSSAERVRNHRNRKKQECNVTVTLPDTDTDTDTDTDKKKIKKEKIPSAKQTKKDVDLVFEHWRQCMKHPTAKLDTKREKFIRNAFSLTFSRDQICEAISGCLRSKHHMGENEQQQRYDGLHVILRDADQIEKFIRLSSSPKLKLREKNVKNTYESSATKARRELAESIARDEIKAENFAWEGECQEVSSLPN